MMRQRIAGGARRKWLTGAALMAAAAMPLGAQGTGNGYLFGVPSGRVTIRAGYAIARAKGDFFDEQMQRFTLDKGDFSSPTIGGELTFRIASRYDLSLSADYAGVRDVGSAYRTFFEFPPQGDSLPIRQSTSFQRVPVTASLRFYLTPPGRSIGTLAWIPNRVVPWVEAGIGGTWYRFRQEGDFVDETTPSCTDPVDPSCPIYTATVTASGWGIALRGAGGIEVSISPRIAATAGARYTWSQATMGDDFEGNKIDLSSVALTLGLTFRL
jgi:hypothetical protein